MSPHSVTVDMLVVKKFDLFDYGDSVVQKLEFSYCKSCPSNKWDQENGVGCFGNSKVTYNKTFVMTFERSPPFPSLMWLPRR